MFTMKWSCKLVVQGLTVRTLSMLCQASTSWGHLAVETPSTGSTHHGLSFKDTFGTQLWLKVSRLRKFRWSKLLKLWSSKSTAGRLVGRLRNQQFWSGHLGSPRHLSSRSSSPIHLASCTTQAGGKLYYLLTNLSLLKTCTPHLELLWDSQPKHYPPRCQVFRPPWIVLTDSLAHVYMLYVSFNIIIHIALISLICLYIYNILTSIFSSASTIFIPLKKKTSESIWPQGGCPPGCTRCQAEARTPTRSTCQRVGSWWKPWSIAVNQ